GDGVLDILVSNSASNNVYLLPGVGGGFFNDRNPTSFLTGLDPEQLFVGHFSNRSNLDLVTVNAGSDDLTFFPGFGPGRTLSSGGLEPIAAVAGDFTHDGLTDLIVAHRGDNHVTLLLAGAGGPRVAATLAPGHLAHLSDVALAGMRGAGVDVYVAGDGEAAVARW